jgi:hypothetical protein
MAKYIITITAEYSVEIPELTQDVQNFITENYEAPILPEPYTDSEYLCGTITYQEETND